MGERIAEIERYYRALATIQNNIYNLNDLAEKLRRRENIFRGTESWDDFWELWNLVERKIKREYDRTRISD